MSEVTISGRHYGEGMCLYSEHAMCGHFSMFAIESAEPFFYILADGYMGLGIGNAYGGS